jgi:hypothetical protein
MGKRRNLTTRKISAYGVPISTTWNRIGMDMVNLIDAVSLRAKRKELLDQLDAVDNALAALGAPSVGFITTPEGSPQEAAAKPASGALPTRLKPPRALSDEHKHALTEGRRKARHSKDVAAGRAREMPDPFPGLAPASSAESQRPRLVKRTRR